MTDVRKITIEFEKGLPVVNLTIQPYGKHAKPFSRRIEIDVRKCVGCEKARRETIITKKQAETAKKETKLELCHRCVLVWRRHIRKLKGGGEGLNSGDTVAEYGRRIKEADGTAALEAVMIDLAGDPTATAQVIAAVKGLEKIRREELAANS